MFWGSSTNFSHLSYTFQWDRGRDQPTQKNQPTNQTANYKINAITRRVNYVSTVDNDGCFAARRLGRKDGDGCYGDSDADDAVDVNNKTAFIAKELNRSKKKKNGQIQILDFDL